MLCDDSDDSCSSVAIHCPIMTTSTEDTCILECEGINSCDSPTIYAMDGINQFEILSPNMDNVDLFCGYTFNESCTMNEDCIAICNQTVMEETSGNGDLQMILPWDNTEDPSVRACTISDDDSQSYTECMIFVDTTTTIAECTNGIKCKIVCLPGLSCGQDTRMTINGASANTLYLETSIDSNFISTGKHHKQINAI